MAAAREERGRAALLYLTDRCPVGCAHCSVDARPLGPRITDWERFEQVLDLLCAEEPLSVVGVSGGEPFVERRGLTLAARRLTDAGKHLVPYTSGNWAASGRVPAWIREVLRLSACLVLSTDSFHAARLPSAAFVNAARTAAEEGVWIGCQVLADGGQPDAARRLLHEALGPNWPSYAEIKPVPLLPYGRAATPDPAPTASRPATGSRLAPNSRPGTTASRPTATNPWSPNATLPSAEENSRPGGDDSPLTAGNTASTKADSQPEESNPRPATQAPPRAAATGSPSTTGASPSGADSPGAVTGSSPAAANSRGAATDSRFTATDSLPEAENSRPVGADSAAATGGSPSEGGLGVGRCGVAGAPVVRYDGRIAVCCNEVVAAGGGPAGLRRDSREPDVLARLAADPYLTVLGGPGAAALTALPAYRDLADHPRTDLCALCWRMAARPRPGPPCAPWPC